LTDIDTKTESIIMTNATPNYYNTRVEFEGRELPKVFDPYNRFRVSPRTPEELKEDILTSGSVGFLQHVIQRYPDYVQYVVENDHVALDQLQEIAEKHRTLRDKCVKRAHMLHVPRLSEDAIREQWGL
jgi:hypothetical protein